MVYPPDPAHFLLNAGTHFWRSKMRILDPKPIKRTAYALLPGILSGTSGMDDGRVYNGAALHPVCP